MIYAYQRISRDSSDTANQRFEIERYCAAHNIHIDEWVEETVSGAKDYKDRALGGLLSRMVPGDLLICTEISRLGRTLYMVFDILREMTERDLRLQTIKDNFRLDDSIETKVLAFAFGLAAEIERRLISQRTTEALARKKAEGVKLGRRPGSRNLHTKLTGKEETIKLLLGPEYHYSYAAAARFLRVDRTTLMRHIRSRMPELYAARAVKPGPDRHGARACPTPAES